MEDEFLKGSGLFVRCFIFVFKEGTLLNVSTKLKNFEILVDEEVTDSGPQNKVGTHYSFFMYIFEGK